MDISPAMVERARALAAGGPAEFVVAGSEALPFDDGAFTAVLCTASFHHYPHPELAVGEMARVLVPGGRLVLADGCSDSRAARIADRLLRVVDRSHIRLYRSDELRGMLVRSGLSVEEVETLWSGGYAIVRAHRT